LRLSSSEGAVPLQLIRMVAVSFAFEAGGEQFESDPIDLRNGFDFFW